MSYAKQTWADGDATKPVSAARMQHIDDGLDAVANAGSRPYDYSLRSDGSTITVYDKFGAQVTTGTDLAVLVNGLMAARIAFQLGPDTFPIATTLSITATGSKVRGWGSVATVIKPTGAHTGPVLQINGATQLDAVEMSGLTVDMSNVNGIIGLLATGSGTARSYIRDVVVTGTTGAWCSLGIDLQNFGGKVSDVTVANPSLAGVRVNGDNSMVGLLEDCTVTTTDAAVTTADCFLVNRTTTPDNGGIYMRRCRTNRTAGTQNFGIRFVSSASGGTNVFATLTDCVADNLNGGPALRLDNCHNWRVAGGYFTRSVNSAIAAEFSACHDGVVVNNWLPNIDLQLTPTRLGFIGNAMTQGGATQVVKVDAANPPGDLIWIGNRVPPPATTPLTNDFGVFANAQADAISMLGTEMLTHRGGGASATFALRDASSTGIGQAKFFQVGASGELFILNNAFNTTLFTLQDNGVFKLTGNIFKALAAPTYSASITPNTNGGPWQTITVTNGTAFTINAPTNPPSASQTSTLTLEFSNTSGGAMGVVTWNAAFKLVGGAFTNPATGNKRFIRFEWNGAAWIEIARASADY